MRVRWNRVAAVLAAVALLIAWPRVAPLVSPENMPDVVPMLFPEETRVEQLRSILVLTVVLVGATLVLAELLRKD